MQAFAGTCYLKDTSAQRLNVSYSYTVSCRCLLELLIFDRHRAHRVLSEALSFAQQSTRLLLESFNLSVLFGVVSLAENEAVAGTRNESGF